MSNYIDLLKTSATKSKNLVCMGLDPVVKYCPYSELSAGKRVVKYFEELFCAMQKNNLTPSAFKPNLGYYSVLDKPFEKNYEGTSALVDILVMIREKFPSIPVILDSKRGDIATSSLNYAKEAFDNFKADCTTVSPYMGSDSIAPFEFKDKGFYILLRTSNKGGADLQNLPTFTSNHLYGDVAKKIITWSSEHKGIGAVVGATGLEELEDIAKMFSQYEIPLLIPGVGSQGGSAKEVVSVLKKSKYPVSLVRINSSSGLTHPWKSEQVPENYIDIFIQNLKNLISEATF